MVDGGSSSVGRLAAYRLEPYLRSQGINKLDYVLLSHLDEDHISGVWELLDAGWPLGCLILAPQAAASENARELLTLAGEKGVAVTCISSGAMICDGEVVLSCLNPAESAPGADPNESSLVMELRYRAFSLLLTGDIGHITEEALLDRWTGVSLLKVAHHGSKGGTGERFLQKLSPQAAVISCGKQNLYGHPHPDTLARLANAGARLYQTKDSGAVIVSTDGKSFWIKTQIQ